MPRRSPALRPPYSAHPLFRLRRASLITSVVGVLLTLVAIGALVSYNEYNIPPFLFAIVLQFISFIFCLHDIITYASHSTRSPAARRTAPAPARENNNNTTPAPAPALSTEDPAPKWPSRRLLITDIVLALAFQWLFWGLFSVIVSTSPRYYYGNGAETFEAYANLTNLVASILHAIAFWKELLARKYAAWKRDLEARVCRNCARTVEDEDEEEGGEDVQQETGVVHAEAEASAERPGFLSRLSKSWVGGVHGTEAEGRDGSVAGASVHEALLATPDESNAGAVDFQGYGTLAQSVESVASVASAPETIVKKMEKGKKRLVDIN